MIHFPASDLAEPRCAFKTRSILFSSCLEAVVIFPSFVTETQSASFLLRPSLDRRLNDCQEMSWIDTNVVLLSDLIG